jgi:hypothetical protein
VMFENLVRQSLVHKEIRKPQYYADKIGLFHSFSMAQSNSYELCLDEVQSRDIVRIAERMLNSKLSMAAYGDLSYLPTYEKIRSMI